MIDFWRSERLVAELGSTNDGIVDDDIAAKAELSPDARSRLRARGVLVKVGNGVDRLRDHPFDFRARCRAALALAGRGSVLGRRTAARLHGCYGYLDCDEVEVLVPRGRDHRLQVGTYVQTRWLPPAHVTQVQGFPVTTLARTFFDLCGDPNHGLSLRHPHHERKMKQLYNECLGRHGMTFTMAVMVLSVLARRGRRGTRLVRKILKHYGPKHRPTKSDVETLMFELVRAHRLTEPQPQGVIVGLRGYIGTVDFVWREAMHIVEVDSSWHDGPLDEEVDERRDADLIEAGYTVERYRYGDIVLEPDRVARELGAIVGGIPPTIAPRTVVGRSG